MRQEFAIDRSVEASVKMGSGRIDVQRAEPGSTWASVQAVDPDHEPSVQLAERATITLDGDHLNVDVPESGRVFRRAEIAVTLALPSRSGLSIKGGAIDVTVRGGVEALSVKMGAGDIDVDEATSAMAVKAGQTDVRVGTCANVAVSTGQGSLTAERVGMTAFKTGQGTVKLGRTDGSVAVKGGAVDLDIREAGAGDVAFATGSGSASIGVAAGTTVEMDLVSASGDVRCDLSMDSSAPAGGAGLKLNLRTGSGNLLVAPAATAAV
ncbi:MAG: hypothetical protein QOE05_1689 [Actinomycetota bacterium]|nr:hypothetical protein [Actinomycetota bacterium]